MTEYTEYRIIIKPYGFTEEAEFWRSNDRRTPMHILKKELDKQIQKARSNWALEYIHIEKRRVKEELWHMIELDDKILGRK